MNIGDILIDKDGKECIVLNKSTSSYQISIKAKTAKGVDSIDWYPEKDVEIRFKLK